MHIEFYIGTPSGLSEKGLKKNEFKIDTLKKFTKYRQGQTFEVKRESNYKFIAVIPFSEIFHEFLKDTYNKVYEDACDDLGITPKNRRFTLTDIPVGTSLNSKLLTVFYTK